MTSIGDNTTLSPNTRLANFDKHVRSIMDAWSTEQTHWADMFDALHDDGIRDNIIIERNASLSAKMCELCDYLRVHWDIVKSSPKLKDAVYFKVLDMCNLLPDFFEVGMTFIEDMYAVDV